MNERSFCSTLIFFSIERFRILRSSHSSNDLSEQSYIYFLFNILLEIQALPVLVSQASASEQSFVCLKIHTAKTPFCGRKGIESLLCWDQSLRHHLVYFQDRRDLWFFCFSYFNWSSLLMKQNGKACFRLPSKNTLLNIKISFQQFWKFQSRKRGYFPKWCWKLCSLYTFKI